MQELIFASYPAFRALPERTRELDREVAAKELGELIDSFGPQVTVRGLYSCTGFGGRADLMLFVVTRSAEDAQDFLVAFRRTELGRALELQDAFLGLVRPAEFTPDHLPAFVQGRPPKPYITVYPYVRTAEWYLLPPEERAALLREHGEAGREFPDVWANTTSAFGLGDHEWILCFEADGPDRLVELLRRLRATGARRYTKTETPFYTGIRKDPAAAVAGLP